MRAIWDKYKVHAVAFVTFVAGYSLLTLLEGYLV